VTKSYVDAAVSSFGQEKQESFAGPGTVFVLSQIPLDDSNVKLYVNGSFQTQGVHYTIAGQTVTMASALAADQVLDAVYLYGAFAVPSVSVQTTRFVMEDAIIPFVALNGPHFQNLDRALASVYLCALNSGTSGSTVVQVNQYRAGVLFDSATASLPASSGQPSGVSAALSSTLNLEADDIVTVDVTQAAAGASDLSVEF
jgi:hypothetical protein